MVYFLVNNDYQLIDANRHAAALKEGGEPVSLILVPHTLKSEPPANIYSRFFRFDSPAKGRRWPAAWLLYFLASAKVRSGLHPNPGDRLILYTEYELLNHLIVKRFRTVGAKVILIEDGGVGTYLPFSTVAETQLTLRERIFAFSVRCLPELSATRFKKINGVVFRWLPDEEVDLLCVYRQFTPERSIRTVAIRTNAEPRKITPCLGRVIFLNECIYDHYQDESNYLRGLSEILTGLTFGYENVLFKFHPRETGTWRDRIKEQVLARFPAIQIIEENQPIETMLERFAPEALASYFSSPLLNLSGTGIEPLFLYHLLDDLKDQPVFAQLTALLRQWNYHFALDWSAVRTGYKSNICLEKDLEELPLLSEVLRCATFPTLRN